MENSPHNTNETDEDESEKDESSTSTTSSSKKARLLAHAAVQSNAKQVELQKDKGPKKESLWEAVGPNKPAKGSEFEELAEIFDVEELTEDEEQFAEEKIAVAHQDAEAAEPTPPEGSVDAKVVQARAAFRSKIINQNKSSDEALAETMEELELLLADEAESESEFAEADIAEELLSPDLHSDVIESDDTDEGATATTGPVSFSTAKASRPASIPSSAPAGPLSSGTGGGGHGTPPPVVPTVAGPVFGPPPIGPAYAPLPSAVAPAPPAPAHETMDDYHVPHPATSALIGGIIGYFIGRRRGRIRTEKKLLPIQKKLEKRVKNLEFDISQKEDKISKAVRERATAQRDLLDIKRSNEQLTVHSLERPVKKPAKSIERLIKATFPEVTPGAKERRVPAPEAHQLHGKKSATESIGKVLIRAESVPVLEAAAEAATLAVSRVEKPKANEKESKPAPALKEHRAETMSHTELLSLSEKIGVNGSSLRQIYETRLVGEKGLRRLVNEHLRGGDIERVLRQEITEHQVDFERDPVMRDHGSQGAQGGGSATRLQDFLQRADATSFDDSEEAAFIKAQAAFEAREHAKQKRHRRLLDASMITSILVLAALLALLLLKQ